MESRIVALSDVYDALCSERPYKAVLSEGEAMDIIRGEAGSHFDPEIYAAFERSIAAFRSIRNDLSDTAYCPLAVECVS